jgi:hypothetical protein
MLKQKIFAWKQTKKLNKANEMRKKSVFKNQ